MPKPRAIFVMPYVIAQELLTRSELGRTPEPMVMDEPVGAAAFHEAGKVKGSNMPMYELCARAMSRLLPEGGAVLDLGSGSGRYLTHLARHRPDVGIVGLDLSDAMIATGRRLLDEEGLADRISLLEADITTFAAEVPARVDLISSIWALHHLPSVEHLDACLGRIAAVRKEHGCAVFLADFARFKNPRSFPMMLSAISGFPPALKPDGVASERAAWPLSELTEALERAALGDLHRSLASPLAILQIHWARGRGAADGSDEDLWREVELPRGVRFDTAFFQRFLQQLP
jgi:SAM-dependent methyltransferase